VTAFGRQDRLLGLSVFRVAAASATLLYA